MSRKMERRLTNLEAKVKRIEDLLELSDIIASFEWKHFTERDKRMLHFLLSRGREGAHLDEIAEHIGLDKPSRKVIVSRRLTHIAKVSRKLRRFPIVVSDRRRWYLNYNDFNFQVKTDEA